MTAARTALAALAACVLIPGCGGPPPVYPVTGKVTLAGKAHERLLVYFRPVNAPVSEYNLGVAETDKAGNLALKTAAGAGLEAGEYKVTFACLTTRGPQGVTTAGADDKPDDQKGATVVDLVPPPFDDKTSQATTPVTFTVRKGQDNAFAFDIPAKK